MLRFSIILLLALSCSRSLATQLLLAEFRSGDGFSDGTSLDGVRNWSAQPGGWVAADTAGIGYARCEVPWSRALNYTPLASSLDVEETIALEVAWRGEGLLDTPQNASVFALGISDSLLNPGNNVPALRVDVSIASNGTLRFGSGSDLVSVDLADVYTGGRTNTNWIAIRMEITRTFTADVFQIALFVTDLERQEPLGSVSYLVEDAVTYQAADVLPAMRTLQVLGSEGVPGTMFSGSHVDRVFVESVTRLIPDPGFETGASSALWGEAEVVQGHAHSGSFSARLSEGVSGEASGLRRTVTGLLPNTAYTFRAHVKTEGGSANIGVKDYGNPEVTRPFNGSTYQLVEVEFATGEGVTTATCYVYNGPGGASVVDVDDLSLVASGPDWPPLPVATGSEQLVFSDEFNREGGIDLSKWTPEIGFKRNNEAQYYRAGNLSQTGGNLVITARREQVLNADYDPDASDWRKSRQYAYWTSGSIKSEQAFQFLYGRIECRAKITNLPGTWPAVWTVGGGEWPATGEIDIMENYGGKLLANFATADSGRYTPRWDSTQLNVSSLPLIEGSPWVDHFHTWELVWSPDSAAIYMDGILLNTFDPATRNASDSFAHPGIAPFRSFSQLLWLNLAIGGNGGGDHSGLPGETVFLVDYIRVYQREHPGYPAGLDLVNDNDLRVDFPSLEGRRYSVMESRDLTNWTEVVNLRGTGRGMSHFEKNGRSDDRAFYGVWVNNTPWIDPETP